MTLDYTYTNLDVFFHMANHYRKIRNAKSVIDCSPPKGCNQNDQSRSSKPQQCKVPPSPCPTSKAIRNECLENLNWLCPNTVENNKRSCSAPPRNKRLVYQTATLSIERRKSPTRPKSLQPSVKRAPQTSNSVAKSTKKKSSSAKSKPESLQKNNTLKKSSKTKSTKKPITCHEPSCPDSIDKKRMEQRLESLRTCNQPGCSAYKQKKQIENAIHGTVSCNQSASPCCADKNKKMSTQAKKDSTPVKEHEYLYFMLRITEDILRNNKYTVDEMEEVFKSHFEANKGRLDEAKMREHIDHLKKHLNYPVCVCDEKTTASDDNCHCCPTVTLDFKTNKPGKCSCADPRCATNTFNKSVEKGGASDLSKAEGGAKKNVTGSPVAATKTNVTGDGNVRKKSAGVVSDSVKAVPKNPTRAEGGGEKNATGSSVVEKEIKTNVTGDRNIGKKSEGAISDSVRVEPKKLTRPEERGEKNVTGSPVAEKEIKTNVTGNGNIGKKSEGAISDSVRVEPKKLTRPEEGGEKNMTGSSAAEKASNSTLAEDGSMGKKSEDESKKENEPINVEEENKKSTSVEKVNEAKVTDPLFLVPGEPKKSISLGGGEEKVDMGGHGVVQNRTEGFVDSKSTDATEHQETIKNFNECINPVDCGTKPGNTPSLIGKDSYAISEMDNKRIRETATRKPEEKLSEVVFYNPEVGSMCHCSIALRKTALKIKTEVAPENEEYILVEGPVCMPKAMLEEKTVPVLIENVSSILLDSDSDHQRGNRPAVSKVNLFQRSAGTMNNVIVPNMPESISDHIDSGVTEIKIEEYDLTPQREQNNLQTNADNKGERRRSVVQILPNISYYSNSRSSKSSDYDDDYAYDYGEEQEGEEEAEEIDFHYEIDAYYDSVRNAGRKNDSSTYQWEIFNTEEDANENEKKSSDNTEVNDLEEKGITDKGSEKEIVELFHEEAKDIIPEKTERVKPKPENSNSSNQPEVPANDHPKTYGAEEDTVEEKGTTDKEGKKELADLFNNRSTQVKKGHLNPRPEISNASNPPLSEQTSSLPTVENNVNRKWEHYREDLDESDIISRMSEESFNIDLRKANNSKTSESRVSIIKIDKQLPRSDSEIMFVERALSGTNRNSSLLRKSELEAAKSENGEIRDSFSTSVEESERMKPETTKVDHKNDETYFVPSFIVVQKEEIKDTPVKTENAPVMDPLFINYSVTSVVNQEKPHTSPQEDSARTPVNPVEKEPTETPVIPAQYPEVPAKASESPVVYPEISKKAPESPVKKHKDPVRTPASSGKNKRDPAKTPVTPAVPTKTTVSPTVPKKAPVRPAVPPSSPTSCCLGRSNEPDYKTALARLEALKPELKNVMITKSEPAHVGHSPNSPKTSSLCVVDKTHTGTLHCNTGTCCPKHKDVSKAEPATSNNKFKVPFVVPSSQRSSDDLRNKYHFLLQDASTSVTSTDLRKAEEAYYKEPLEEKPQPEPEVDAEPKPQPEPYYAIEEPEPVAIPSPITLKTLVPESEVQGEPSPPATPRRSVQLHLLYESAPKAGPPPVHHEKRQSILVNPLVEDDYKLTPDSITEIHPAKYSTDTDYSGERNLPRVFEYSTRGQKKPMVAPSKPGEKYFEYAYQRKRDSLTESLDRVSDMESITKNSDFENEDYLRPRSTASVHQSVGSTSDEEYPVRPQESEDKSEFISETSILVPKNKEPPRVRYSLSPEGYDHEEIIRRLDVIPEPDRTPNQISTIRKITQKLEDFRKIDPNDLNKKFQYSNPENFEIRRLSVEDMPANFDPKNAKKQKKACCGLIQPSKAKKMVPRRM